MDDAISGPPTSEAPGAPAVGPEGATADASGDPPGNAVEAMNTTGPDQPLFRAPAMESIELDQGHNPAVRGLDHSGDQNG